MKHSTLLAFTTAALMVTGSAFACPKKDKNQSPGQDEGVYEVSTESKKAGKCGNKDSGSDEGVYEVAEREGDAKEGKEGKKRERPEGEREGRERKEHSPLRGLDLSEEQQKEVKAIMEAARESAQEVLKEAKAKKEAGEEVDRKAVHEQMMEIRKGAMKNVYDNVLNDEQRAKMDEHRKKMEERKAEREEREGKDGERPERPRKDKGGDKGEGKGKGDGLDL